MMDRGEDFVFVDVRNPDEFEICAIPGTVKLPLPELPQRFQELPKDKLIVLHCHHGPRSKRAMQFLRSQGYRRVKNVPGGIDAWSERIEPDMPRY
jgi:rhodanese-related sulfurtransferase